MSSEAGMELGGTVPAGVRSYKDRRWRRQALGSYCSHRMLCSGSALEILTLADRGWAIFPNWTDEETEAQRTELW